MDVIEKKIFETIEPIIAEEGCEVLEVQVIFEDQQRILRVTIDKTDGVGLEDCARVSSAIEDIIEVKEFLSGRYRLEVSSPGSEKPLRKKEHFERALGKVVKLATKEKIEGRGNFKGTLEEVSDTKVAMMVDNKRYEIPLEEIKRAKQIL
jgi:ribosome maturation factor RimP